MSDAQDCFTLLDAYKEALNSYEKLELTFELPFHVVQPSRVKLLEDCFNKIQNILDYETKFYKTANSEFEYEVCNSLHLLRENLIQITNKLQKVVLATNLTEVNNVCSKSKADKLENKQEHFEEVVDNTKTCPKINSFQEIAGLNEIKNVLISLVILPINQPQLYIGQKSANIILLYGPPGTGKTVLVHALAAEASATLFSVNSSDILSEYVGKSEKTLSAFFKKLKQANNCTILFMDEIDGICQRRRGNEHEYSRRLKTELMCQLSSLEGNSKTFIICATNCPWDLDSAFLRRFQRRIYVPLPTYIDRYNLLSLLTKDRLLQITSNEWDLLVKNTEGYSGSDLADIVRHAFNIPIVELTETQLWQHIGDNQYKPVQNNFENSSEVVVSNISEMPMGSVVARPVEISDLIAAINIVHPTVSSDDILKYEQFFKNA